MNWNRKDIKQYSRKMIQVNYWKTFFVSTLRLSLSSITIASILRNIMSDAPELISNIFRYEFEHNVRDPKIVLVLITLFSSVSLLMLMARAVINIFFANPIEVGAARYMKKALQPDEKGKIADIVHIFDGNYLNCIKVMFLYNLVITIGSFLFVVPGLYFSYKYRMVPYLLDENTNLTAKEAFQKSGEIMKGHMIKSLVLDLSFIPLYILEALTLGLAGIFYVEPYKDLVDAKLFLTLTERNEEE